MTGTHESHRTDSLTKAQRSALMARIQGRNTRPERAIATIFRSKRFRFDSQVTSLPGTPDFVLAQHKIAIFVHGCFWHRHRCKRGRSTPASNIHFWKAKFLHNKNRDQLVRRRLRRLGWKVLIIWECQIKSRNIVVERLRKFLAKANKKRG